MFQSTKSAFVALALPLLLAAACQPNDLVKQEPSPRSASSARAASNRFIVTFKESADLDRLFPDDNDNYEGRLAAMRSFISQRINAGIAQRAERIYTYALRGFALPLTEEEATFLRALPSVEAVTSDGVVTLSPTTKNVSAQSTQTIPWGITRIGGFVNYITPTRRAWIIDTGVDYDHPDLNVDVANSRGFVWYTSSGDDDHYHGTHVAGTVAARNNDFGVVGVAAGAKVVAVKVLDYYGSGYWSDVIAGIDYVGTKGKAGDVANMSLGGGAYQPVDNAVVRVSKKGIRFSLAAGNSYSNANYFSPARANGPNIVTISAMDINDNFAWFSNWGNPPIDFAAPGVDVLSTFPGGYYGYLSGTSMAAPHVAGIMLVNGGKIYTSGTVHNDPDGNPDKIAALKWSNGQL
ncbi:S8 family serine peptidase [Spirosoma taeanense]|uniref:S8 family serine peptidase n=1 Tax=Spirosoma taeanense TaxID=2735870 RepID=A0A6M5YCQ9_9BACT|nr:S8 family serine peptidase [Spirosoma taeanense]QJW91053.1 S8 family serine peptidase [Spirosoma taeanense]